VSGDKTLMQDSLTGKDLTEDEARHLAEKFQNNSEAMARFMAIEDQLDDIIKVVENGKKAVKWLVGLLIANYIGTFWGSIESLL